MQADGKILVGGNFTQLGGQTRSRIGRLSNTDAALHNLSVNSTGTTVTWLRSASSPEVDRVTFHLSTGTGAIQIYTSLGNGTRIAGGWQLTGLSLPANKNIFIRARGFYSTDGGGPISIVETVRNAFVSAFSTIIINPPFLLSGTVNTAYSQTISASGTDGPFSFAVSDGSPPPGLTLNPTSGELSGTPMRAGTFNFTVTATEPQTLPNRPLCWPSVNKVRLHTER